MTARDVKPLYVDRGLRILRAAMVLAVSAWLGYQHASYWTIVLVGMVMVAFEVQARAAQWGALAREAGWRQAAPGLIVAFVSQVVFVALFYAAGFSARIARSDPPTAALPTLDDLLAIGLTLVVGLAIGEALRRETPPA